MANYVCAICDTDHDTEESLRNCCAGAVTTIADLRKQLEQAEALLLKFTHMRTDTRGFVHDFTMNVVAANNLLEALSPTVENGEKD